MRISAINTQNAVSRQTFKAHLNVTPQGEDFLRRLSISEGISKGEIVQTFRDINNMLGDDSTLSICENKNNVIRGCVTNGKFATEFSFKNEPEKPHTALRALKSEVFLAALRIHQSKKPLHKAVSEIICFDYRKD